MRLARFLEPGSSAPRTGEVRDGRVYGYAEEQLTIPERLADPEAVPVESASWGLEEVTLLAPVPGTGAIFGIGLNYADHVEEIGGEAPERPVVFAKLSSSLAAPGAPVRCPPVVRRLDYEGELAVVMGPGRSVAGYAVADDLTARDLQAREPQWVRAKGADGFCPLGPWITSADEIEDPHALALRTWVNGELRQHSNTSNLIFAIPELIEFIAETCTLQSGDVILTGTPGGVGMGLDPPAFLAPGDVVRIEIERLGHIEHLIAD